MTLLTADIFDFRVWILIYGILFLRYFLIAGAGYLLFWKTKHFQHLRIQETFPENISLIREFSYSIVTFIIFAIYAILILSAVQNGITMVYTDISEFGWSYFFLSIIASIIIHDAYFYWAHRFMHLQSVFRIFHRVHHLSVNPSPWAAFSFQPMESIVEAMILPLIVFIIPMHPYALFIFLLFITLMNVLGHLGYEIFPSGFTRHPVWNWMNTSTHHNMHHRFFSCNYGLYFNWWDRIMHTNHENYHEFFENVKSKKTG